MKKRWISLAALMLLLLLIPSVVMVAQGEEVCDHKWGPWRSVDEIYHDRICTECGEAARREHTGGGATCTTEGTCEACGASYKDPNNHKDVTYEYVKISETQHEVTATCEGCGQTVSTYNEAHIELYPASCIAPAKCERCMSSYGEMDPNNHVGDFTYAYEKISETQHEVTVTCKGCGKVSSTYNEAHIELYPASCIAPARCALCMSFYGDLDPDGHEWASWGPYDENQHVRECLHDTKHKEYADHTGGGATCTKAGTCEVGLCNTSYKDPNNHEGPFTYAYKTILDPDNQISATEHEVTVTCEGCGQTVSTDTEKHSLENHDGKAATCTEKGWDAYVTCADCDYSTYQEIPVVEHHFVVDPPVAPTCFKTGLTAGTHCDRCGEIGEAQEIVEKTEHTYGKGVVTKPSCCYEGYTTYTCKDCGFKLVTDKVKPLSHWYDLWEPTGNGKNSAPCKRPGCTYVKTTDCANWDFMLVPAGAEKAEGFSICPVCGAMSDGGRLELVKTAVATPVTYWTPEGDLLVRCGTMENGETIMCVGFEFDARLVQCYGSTKFTVPAELLEGYRLMLLDEEGNETEVEVKVVGQKATFLVDYSADAQSRRTPVRMFHLVPLEPEVTEETTEAGETAGK